jgi:O-antigen/teichoic acid export membrane protein
MVILARFLQRVIRSPRMEANAFFLWATAITGAAAGFAFWNLSAWFYTAGEVGIASSAISLMLLVSGITSLGIGIGIVRFLGTDENPTRMVNTALGFTTLTSILIGSLCVMGINIWSPGLVSLRQPVFFAVFLVLLISTTHNLLLQMVFLSLKRASSTLWMIILLNGIRLSMLIFFRMEGSQGIVASLAVATLISNLLAFWLVRRLVPDYSPGMAVSRSILCQLVPYSFLSGMADFLSRVPAMLAPLLVLEYLGAATSAQIYIAWMMGSLVLSPSASLAQSAFSEGSSNPMTLRGVIRKSARYSLLITAGIAILVFLTAGWLLGLFGPDYRAAAPFLQWLCVAAPLFALNSLFAAAFRVQNRLWLLILVNAVIIAVFAGPQAFLLKTSGLTMTGITWLIAQALAVLISLVAYLHGKPADHSVDPLPAAVGVPDR